MGCLGTRWKIQVRSFVDFVEAEGLLECQVSIFSPIVSGKRKSGNGGKMVAF